MGVLRGDSAGRIRQLVRPAVQCSWGHRRAGRDQDARPRPRPRRGVRDTPMCGRTHGQPGLPVTFGFKGQSGPPNSIGTSLGSGWAAVAGNWPSWAARSARWSSGPTPLPTCWTRSPSGWGSVPPVPPWLSSRDGVAEFIWLPAAIAATVGKIGNEVYQLQRPEIGELHEPTPPGTVGSTTMPHKRNPEISEHLVTLSRVVRAQAGLALEGTVCEHERDGRAWKAEWLAVPEAGLAFGACVAAGAQMLDGLGVDAAR